MPAHTLPCPPPQTSTHPPQAPDLFQQPTNGCSDPIAAITANATTLIIGRSSGVVYRYALPSLALTGQHLLRCRPQQLALNCDSTKLGVIDFSGVFSFFDTTLPGAGGATGTVRVGASGLSTMTGDHVGNDRKVRHRCRGEGEGVAVGVQVATQPVNTCVGGDELILRPRRAAVV